VKNRISCDLRHSRRAVGVLRFDYKRLEAAVRVFCMIVLGVALSLRIVAFAMDNAAEAATHSIAAAQR
jgi:hypothetical protein